jgi:hypothetical protein
MPKSQQSWFDPSILRHSGMWGAADEAVLNPVHRKKFQKQTLLTIYIAVFSLPASVFHECIELAVSGRNWHNSVADIRSGLTDRSGLYFHSVLLLGPWLMHFFLLFWPTIVYIAVQHLKNILYKEMFLKGKDSQHCTSVESVTLNPNNESFEFIVGSSNNTSKQLHDVLT